MMGPLGFAGIMMAMVALFLLASFMSRAGRLARALRPFVHRSVRIAVWGQALPAAPAAMEVDSIRSVGAGLLIFIRLAPGERRKLLKVAQPGEETLEERRAVIGRAAYVQWDGRRIPRADGVPALTMEVPA